jgi:hypothetical protein
LRPHPCASVGFDPWQEIFVTLFRKSLSLSGKEPRAGNFANSQSLEFLAAGVLPKRIPINFASVQNNHTFSELCHSIVLL